MHVFLKSKKVRYAGYSLVSVCFLLYASNIISHEGVRFGVLLWLLLISGFGIFFVHYPNITLNQCFSLTLLPLHLMSGVLLSLTYFPNLSTLFKIGALVGVGVLLYIINLVNNIFLVVSERQKPIPLFRVATVWSQILVVIVAIPFFAGIFKTPFVFFYQSSLVALSAFLFSLYSSWTLDFDKEVVDLGIGERALVSLLVAFVVFASSLAVSFLPVESFLRALFGAAMLMSGVGYVHAHYKNRITRNMLFEYGLIASIFLFILMVFRP
jgi:hypothetical protein